MIHWWAIKRKSRNEFIEKNLNLFLIRMLVRVGHLSGEVKTYEMPEGACVSQLMEVVEEGVSFELVCAGE